jgi:hypothetical protein
LLGVAGTDIRLVSRATDVVYLVFAELILASRSVSGQMHSSVYVGRVASGGILEQDLPMTTSCHCRLKGEIDVDGRGGGHLSNVKRVIVSCCGSGLLNGMA